MSNKVVVDGTNNVSAQQLSELLRQIGTGEITGRELQAMIEHRNPRVDTLTELIVDLDAPPFIPNGWMVESHKQSGRWRYDATKVSLYLSDDQKDGKGLTGSKFRQELKSQLVMNANMLEFYLAHTSLIPEDWKGKAVFFWGTVYCDASGRLYVRCLGWRGKRWDWSDRCLGDVWGCGNPAALLGK